MKTLLKSNKWCHYMKYKVTVPFSGYVRGYQTYLVEAESEQEALDDYWSGELIEDEIVRDDREISEPYI
ncbi:hypothetical protein RGZ1_23 [Morganella phage vB_MmoM_Rgz1]|nr:hypothetical protein RGZ1_23 [Morganella phage vB_MmoM_Rgz1]